MGSFGPMSSGSQGTGRLSTMSSGLHSLCSRLSVLNVTLTLEHELYSIITGIYIHIFLPATPIPSAQSLKTRSA